MPTMGTIATNPRKQIMKPVQFGRSAYKLCGKKTKMHHMHRELQNIAMNRMVKRTVTSQRVRSKAPTLMQVFAAW